MAIAALLVPMIASGQACDDEMPVPQKPQLKKCGFLDLVCQAQNSQAKSHYDDAARTFMTQMEVSAAPDNAQYTTEYRARGCRGAAVIPEVSPGVLNTLHVTILTPSGALLYDKDLTVQQRPFFGDAVQLPETGLYTVRLSSTAGGKTEDVCTKFKSFLSTTCLQHGSKTTYPVSYAIRFSGGAGNAPLTPGDRTDGTVGPQQPFTRRLSLDRGAAGRVRVNASGGGNITGHLESEDGTLVAQQSGSQLSLLVPPSRRGGTYLLSVTLGPGQAPTGVTIAFDTTMSGSAVAAGQHLAFSQETVAEFVNLPDLSNVRAAEAAKAEWTFTAPSPGRAHLTVVPSGLAGLSVMVGVYDGTTEETVLPETEVSRSTTFAVALRRAGNYIVVVRPVSVREQPMPARVKYTLELAP